MCDGSVSGANTMNVEMKNFKIKLSVHLQIFVTIPKWLKVVHISWKVCE